MSEYTPSAEVKDALRALSQAEEAVSTARKAVYEAVANDLKANPEVTNAQAAEKLPFSQETVRVIAREYDVPRKRQPTVKSIKGAPKAKKDTPGKVWPG